jgi:hypothetical protein
MVRLLFCLLMVGTLTMREIKPQKGFQEDFLKSAADIAIGGGAAGAGKTYALLMESARYSPVKGFGGVIFRRTYPQIRAEGGLWDTSLQLFPEIGAKPKESQLEYSFRSKSRIKFSHLEYEKNVLDWQGSQIPFIGFDELTHFTEHMFFYLLSRNRSTCGVKPYIRATCNPDPDSWVARFIEWWICQDDKSPLYGFPIPERAGKLRYFMKDADSVVWGDNKKEVLEKVPHLIEPILQADPTINPLDLVKSATFIPGDIYSNKELLKSDPGYLANLLAQDETTQLQLLKGNWKVKIDGDEIINYLKFRDVFSNDFVKGGLKYITADIALKGSDNLIVAVWDGFRLIDIEVIPYSKGNVVIDTIKNMARKWSVPQSRILYDDDGIGSFVDGFIENSITFHNGAKPFNDENYKMLRDQCYFKMADRIAQDGYYIAPEVAKKKVTDHKGKVRTVEEMLAEDRRAIKRDKPDHEGKYAVIPKQQRKNIIGRSTDFMDIWMMREYFELTDIGTGWTETELSDYL